MYSRIICFLYIFAIIISCAPKFNTSTDYLSMYKKNYISPLSKKSSLDIFIICDYEKILYGNNSDDSLFCTVPENDNYVSSWSSFNINKSKKIYDYLDLILKQSYFKNEYLIYYKFYNLPKKEDNYRKNSVYPVSSFFVFDSNGLYIGFTKNDLMFRSVISPVINDIEIIKLKTRGEKYKIFYSVNGIKYESNFTSNLAKLLLLPDPKIIDERTITEVNEFFRKEQQDPYSKYNVLTNQLLNPLNIEYSTSLTDIRDESINRYLPKYILNSIKVFSSGEQVISVDQTAIHKFLTSRESLLPLYFRPENNSIFYQDKLVLQYEYLLESPSQLLDDNSIKRDLDIKDIFSKFNEKVRVSIEIVNYPSKKDYLSYCSSIFLDNNKNILDIGCDYFERLETVLEAH